jgi:hypothetical protein
MALLPIDELPTCALPRYERYVEEPCIHPMADLVDFDNHIYGVTPPLNPPEFYLYATVQRSDGRQMQIWRSYINGRLSFHQESFEP